MANALSDTVVSGRRCMCVRSGGGGPVARGVLPSAGRPLPGRRSGARRRDPWRAPPEIAPRQTGAAVTRPPGAHISGRSSARQAGGLRTTVRSNRSEPMTSGNAPAADCSHNRGRLAATLMIACGRADERSPTAVNRISVSACQRESEWSGAGSNRRPSAFQGFRRPLGQNLLGIAPAQLTGIGAGQWAYSVIIATVPPCAAESRFVCGLPVVSPPEARTCGSFVGLLEARTGTTKAEPGAGSWESRPAIIWHLWPTESARTTSIEPGQESLRKVSSVRARYRVPSADRLFAIAVAPVHRSSGAQIGPICVTAKWLRILRWRRCPWPGEGASLAGYIAWCCWRAWPG